VKKLNWTNEQLLAINEDNKNIIVSAGAGSGKTAVLTERVIRKLKNGVNINNLLILTFTNKAAQEMKDRIRSAISKDDSLKYQLDLIDSSYITTFDSFSLSIVKKYSYLLNISNNVKIADSSTLFLETKKIIDNIFDDLYKEKNIDFLNLIDSFTIKNDNDIKKYILNINKSLDLKYDKIEYLDNYINDMYSDDKVNSLITEYVCLLKRKIKDIEKLLDEISYCTDVDYFSILNQSFLPL
jgi:ATP-dependent helicase/nuclease subunit A